MHKSVHNLIQIEKEIQSNIINFEASVKLPKIIAVSKTHAMTNILPLINHGHLDFGDIILLEIIFLKNIFSIYFVNHILRR